MPARSALTAPSSTLSVPRVPSCPEIQFLRAVVGGVWGFAHKPGMVSHWPAGLALAFPPPGSVNGTLVLAEGDVNLTFKTYLQSQVVLHIVDDHVMDIEGHGLDAELMRGYWKSWEDAEGHRACYATSHVGFGLNRAARWDALAMVDKRETNGIELIAGDPVVAIDRDARLIAAARMKPALNGVDFSVGDVCSLSFADETFGAVFDLV